MSAHYIPSLMSVNDVEILIEKISLLCYVMNLSFAC